MTGTEYLRLYGQDRGSKYDHLPTLPVAEKVSRILCSYTENPDCFISRA